MIIIIYITFGCFITFCDVLYSNLENSSFSVKNKYETGYILSNSVSFYYLDVLRNESIIYTIFFNNILINNKKNT